MFSQFISRIAFAAVATLASLAIVSAQGKMAVINSQRAVIETAEIKKAQAELEAKYKPRQQQMELLQAELQTLQQKLQSKTVSPQNEQDLTTQGQRKQRELTRLGEDLQADVDRERNEVLGKTGQRMQEVVKKMAEEKGLDVVVDASNIVFFKPTLDITTEAVAAYNKAYPVK